MNGDPNPAHVVAPDCCEFHATGGHWDSGHSARRAGGNYGDPPAEVDAFSYTPLTEAEWLWSFGDMWGFDPPCEALASRDPGRQSK